MIFRNLSTIEKAIEKYLPKDNSELSEAVRYSMKAGGKRFRPVLCVEAAALFGYKKKDLYAAASAIEMIHTFTLVHDDLPAMDNSDLRRGKPTCHKVFGEDIAVLAGDALNTLAFITIAKNCDDLKAKKISLVLGKALMDVVEGQVQDLENEGKQISLADLKKMHLLKTSALIEASLEIGAIAASASQKQIKALSSYGRHLGLAFQIADDILDVVSSTKVLGKPAGLDEKNNKSTYVSILGLEKATKLAQHHKNEALKSLSIFKDKAEVFRSLAEFVVNRKS